MTAAKTKIYVSGPKSLVAEGLDEHRPHVLGMKPVRNILDRDMQADGFSNLSEVSAASAERTAMISNDPNYVDLSAVTEQMAKILDPLPKKSQRKILRRIGLDEKVRIKDGDRFYAFKDPHTKARTAAVQELQVTLLKMLRILARPDQCRLQQAEGSQLHKLQETAHEGNVIAPVGPPSQAPEMIGVVQPEFGQAVFLIEHDWASVFDKADEIGEWRMPGDSCCFEFQISGYRFIAMVIGKDGVPSSMMVFAHISKTWALCDSLLYDHGVWNRGIKHNMYGDGFPAFSTTITRQIRAISIMLDAEVAEHEIIRAPHKLNEQRERKGKPPLNAYHVVRLTKRSRGAPRLDRDPNAEPTHHKRLHWVRGHWRHFEGHRTWIRWHLRGDEALGIIEKEYRL